MPIPAPSQVEPELDLRSPFAVVVVRSSTPRTTTNESFEPIDPSASPSVGSQFALGVFPVTRLSLTPSANSFLGLATCAIVQESLAIPCLARFGSNYDAKELERAAFVFLIEDVSLDVNAYDLFFKRYAVANGHFSAIFLRQSAHDARQNEPPTLRNFAFHETSWTDFPGSGFLSQLISQGLRQVLLEALHDPQLDSDDIEPRETGAQYVVR